jgi:hypothetical protein
MSGEVNEQAERRFYFQEPSNIYLTETFTDMFRSEAKSDYLFN